MKEIERHIDRESRREKVTYKMRTMPRKSEEGKCCMFDCRAKVNTNKKVFMSA